MDYLEPFRATLQDVLSLDKPVLGRFWVPAAASIVLCLLLDKFIVYPLLRHPLRNHKPSVKAAGLKMILEKPRGKTALEMMRQHPDADLIRIVGSLGGMAMIPASPAALRDVLATNGYDFIKPTGFVAFLARIIGYGLVLSEGEMHKRQRKSLTPSFHIRKIRALYPTMWKETRIFVDVLKKEMKSEGHVDIIPWASKLTLDIIGIAAFAHDFASLTTAEHGIVKAFLAILEPDPSMIAYMFTYQILPSWLLNMLPLHVNSVVTDNTTYLRGVCRDLLEQKRAAIAKNLDEDDIFSSVIENGQFTDDEIIDQMLTFIGAGHETTASAIAWSAYVLARRPDIQDRLRAEVRANLPPITSDQPVNSDIFEELPYLNGVCEEILRLYPTVPSTVREAIRDTIIAGTVIPKGTVMPLVPYAINRHPKFWGPDADEPKPERWIDVDDQGVQRRNRHGGAPSNYCELTFLHGSRSCIGQDFARAELRCAIAGLYGQYAVELADPSQPVVAAGTVTVKPEGDMRLLLKPVPGW